MNHPFMKQPEKFWRGVGVGPLKFKEKPKIIAVNAESGPDIFVPVVGLRSDGCEFTIDIAIDSEKLGQIPGPDVFMGFHSQLMLAFGKLNEYKSCECRKDFTCKTHTPPVPN